MSSEPDPSTPRQDPAPHLRREPPPLVKPARSALTVRDMVFALAVLVGVVLLFGGVAQSCSFAPAGPTVDPNAMPAVDAGAALRELRVPFPLRVPDGPPGWRSNSVRQDRLEQGRMVRVGYVSAGGRFMRLLQSDAPEAALLGTVAPPEDVYRRTDVDVDGQRWVVNSIGEQNPVWTAEVPAGAGVTVRMLITGAGDDGEFRALAAAAQHGELLPPRAP